MKALAVAILLCLPLMGCASAEKQGPPLALVLQKCPALKVYSKEQLLKAANELKALPADSEIAKMITDYSKHRDACRVATKTMKKLDK